MVDASQHTAERNRLLGASGGGAKVEGGGAPATPGAKPGTPCFPSPPGSAGTSSRPVGRSEAPFSTASGRKIPVPDHPSTFNVVGTSVPGSARKEFFAAGQKDEYPFGVGGAGPADEGFSTSASGTTLEESTSFAQSLHEPEGRGGPREAPLRISTQTYPPVYNPLNQTLKTPVPDVITRTEVVYGGAPPRAPVLPPIVGDCGHPEKAMSVQPIVISRGAVERRIAEVEAGIGENLVGSMSSSGALLYNGYVMC